MIFWGEDVVSDNCGNPGWDAEQYSTGRFHPALRVYDCENDVIFSTSFTGFEGIDVTGTTPASSYNPVFTYMYAYGMDNNNSCTQFNRDCCVPGVFPTNIALDGPSAVTSCADQSYSFNVNNFTCPGGGTCTYEWRLNGTVLPGLTTDSESITLTRRGGVVSVLITVDDGSGLVCTQELIVAVAADLTCCETLIPDHTVTVNSAQELLTDLGASGSTISPSLLGGSKRLVIYSSSGGQIDVDTNITFEDLEIEFGTSDAGFIMNDDHVLRFDSATVKHCECGSTPNIRGIEAYDGTVEFVNESRIIDAEFGILIESDALAVLRDSEILNCWTGVFVNDANNTLPSLTSPIEMYGMEIRPDTAECGRVRNIGVNITDVDATILGDATQDANEIYGYRWQMIQMKDSPALTMRNNKLGDDPAVAANNYARARGVHIINKAGAVGAFDISGASPRNEFHNLEIGINYWRQDGAIQSEFNDCLFQDCHHGIRVSGIKYTSSFSQFTTFDISNNTFDNQNLLASRIGDRIELIGVNGTDAKNGGGVDINDNTFTNGAKEGADVYVRDFVAAAVSLQRNTSNQTEIGYEFLGNDGGNATFKPQFFVKNCTIQDFSEHGILAHDIRRPSQNVWYNFVQNDISDGDEEASAIEVLHLSSDDIKFVINDNDVYDMVRGRGIVVRGNGNIGTYSEGQGVGCSINENTISDIYDFISHDIATVDPYAGISVIGVPSFVLIRENDIDNSAQTIYDVGKSVGIYLESSPNNQLCLNDITDFNASVLANGDCGQTKMYLNDFKEYTYGVAVFNEGLLGDQFNGEFEKVADASNTDFEIYNNQWDPPMYFTEANRAPDLYCYDSHPRFSRFITQDDGSSPPNLYYTPKRSDFGWSGPIIPEMALEGHDFLPTRNSIMAIPVETEVTLAVGGGDVANQSNSCTSFTDFPTPGSGKTGKVAITTGGRDFTHSDIARFEFVARDTSDTTLYANGAQYIERQRLFDVLKHYPGLTTSYNVLDTFYNDFTGTTIDTLWQIEDKIREAAAQPLLLWYADTTGDTTGAQLDPDALDQKDSLLIQAENLNDAIVPANDIESNHQKINELRIAYLKQHRAAIIGDMAPAHLDALEAVAAQCPLQGGLAVYQARGWLTQLQADTIAYDTCTQVFLAPYDTTSPRKPVIEPMLDDQAGADIALYPNPAKDRVHVAWTLPEGVSGTIEIFNATGARVGQEQISGARGATTIDASAWSAGVYVCRYIGSDGAVRNHKLVILK